MFVLANVHLPIKRLTVKNIESFQENICFRFSIFRIQEFCLKGNNFGTDFWFASTFLAKSLLNFSNWVIVVVRFNTFLDNNSTSLFRYPAKVHQNAPTYCATYHDSFKVKKVAFIRLFLRINFFVFDCTCYRILIHFTILNHPKLMARIYK